MLLTPQEIRLTPLWHKSQECRCANWSHFVPACWIGPSASSGALRRTEGQISPVERFESEKAKTAMLAWRGPCAAWPKAVAQLGRGCAAHQWPTVGTSCPAALSLRRHTHRLSPLKENTNPKDIHAPQILPHTLPIPLASGRPAATSFALCRRQNLPSGEVLGKKAISAMRDGRGGKAGHGAVACSHGLGVGR